MSKEQLQLDTCAAHTCTARYGVSSKRALASDGERRRVASYGWRELDDGAFLGQTESVMRLWSWPTAGGERPLQRPRIASLGSGDKPLLCAVGPCVP